MDINIQFPESGDWLWLWIVNSRIGIVGTAEDQSKWRLWAWQTACKKKANAFGDLLGRNGIRKGVTYARSEWLSVTESIPSCITRISIDLVDRQMYPGKLRLNNRLLLFGSWIHLAVLWRKVTLCQKSKEKAIYNTSTCRDQLGLHCMCDQSNVKAVNDKILLVGTEKKR